MYDLFLKLMGVPAEQVSRIADSRLRFRGDVDLLWIILAAIGLGVMVFLMYRKAAPDLSPVKKYVLATLSAKPAAMRNLAAGCDLGYRDRHPASKNDTQPGGVLTAHPRSPQFPAECRLASG